MVVTHGSVPLVVVLSSTGGRSSSVPFMAICRCCHGHLGGVVMPCGFCWQSACGGHQSAGLSDQLQALPGSSLMGWWRLSGKMEKQISPVGPCKTLGTRLLWPSCFPQDEESSTTCSSSRALEDLHAWHLPATQVLPEVLCQGLQHRWPDKSGGVQPKVHRRVHEELCSLASVPLGPSHMPSKFFYGAPLC